MFFIVRNQYLAWGSTLVVIHISVFFAIASKFILFFHNTLLFQTINVLRSIIIERAQNRTRAQLIRYVLCRNDRAILNYK